jgi:hypothetical protein
MCNHTHVSKLNKERMNQVYQQLAHYRQSGSQGGHNVPHDLLAELPKIHKMSRGGSGGVVDTPSSGVIMGPPPGPLEHEFKVRIINFSLALKFQSITDCLLTPVVSNK